MTSTANALTADALSAYGKMLLDRMNRPLLADLTRPMSQPSIFEPMPMPRKPIIDAYNSIPIIHKSFERTLRMTELEAMPRMVHPDPPMFNGYYLKEHDSCVIRTPVQFRFPRSKGKRIRKKWAKRPENFKIEREYKCYTLEPQKTIFVPPGFIKKIQKAMEDQAL